MTQTTFPEVITENLISDLNFSIQKCEETIKSLESADADSFGSGSQKDKQERRIAFIERAIKNFVVSSLVSSGYPLISQDVFELTRWYKVAFPKDELPYIAEVSMREPDWETVKTQEDKIQMRWVSGKYLVSKGIRNGYGKSAELARLKYVGKRTSDLILKSDLPCEMPLDIEQLYAKFLSQLHEAASKCYSSPIISKYLNIDGDRWSASGYNITTNISANIYWAPRHEDIYTLEQIIPPPGDPVLVVNWRDCNFFIGAWEINTDDDNLKFILDEFVI